MTHPRLIQIHAMPKTGNPNQSKAFDEYVAGEPIQGFVPRKQAKRDLYGYLLPRESGNTVDHTVAVTSGTRTETLGFSKSSGGIVLEWTTVDTGINVQWLNHRGACTRGLQTKWTVVDDDGVHTLVQGGSASEGDSDAASVATLADGFTVDDIIQGSIITKFVETDLGGGEYQIDISTVPMELDFHGDEGGPDHGGTCIDPIVYDNVRYDTRITINWDGNVGIHRIDTTVQVPGQPATAWDATIASRLDLGVCGFVFGFDEFIAYRSESGGKYTVLDDVNVYTGMSLSTAAGLDSVTVTSNVCTIDFTSTQGRQLQTIEKFTLSGSAPADIDGTHDFVWTSGTLAQAIITASDGGYTTTLNSDTQEWWHPDDAYLRTAYKDRLEVGLGQSPKYSGDFQEGIFPNKGASVWSSGGLGRNAAIHRATGVAGYSLDDDFAVGLYVGAITLFGDLSLGNSGLFQWQMVRDATGPVGNSTEKAMMNLWHSRFWSGTTGMPTGPVTNTVYVLTGTYANVQSSITTMDAETNAATGLNGG